MKELSEDTVVGLSLKSLAGIAGAVAILATGWFTLQADIADAKKN